MNEIPARKYPLKKNTKLVFTIFAEHGYSNTSVFKRQEYTNNEVVTGIFETGKSMKIIQAKNEIITGINTKKNK